MLTCRAQALPRDQRVDIHQPLDRPDQARHGEQPVAVLLTKRNCRRGRGERLHKPDMGHEKFRHRHAADQALGLEHHAHFDWPLSFRVGSVPLRGNFASAILQAPVDFCLQHKTQKSSSDYQYCNPVHMGLIRTKVRHAIHRAASPVAASLDNSLHRHLSPVSTPARGARRSSRGRELGRIAKRAGLPRRGQSCRTFTRKPNGQFGAPTPQEARL